MLNVLIHARIYHNKDYLCDQHSAQQNLSTSHQPLNPQPLTTSIPQNPTIFREGAARKALKLTTLIATLAADESLNVPELSGVPLAL